MKKLLYIFCLLISSFCYAQSNVSNPQIIGQPNRNQEVGKGFRVTDSTSLGGKVFIHRPVNGTSSDSILVWNAITGEIKKIPADSLSSSLPSFTTGQLIYGNGLPDVGTSSPFLTTDGTTFFQMDMSTSILLESENDLLLGSGVTNNTSIHIDDLNQTVDMFTTYNGVNRSFFFLANFSADGLNGDLQLGDIIHSKNNTTLVISDLNQQYELNKLAGAGTRMVVVDPGGILGTQPIPGGGAAWNLTGNTATDPASNFVGTTDSTLHVKANNKDGVTIDTANNVLLGDSCRVLTDLGHLLYDLNIGPNGLPVPVGNTNNISNSIAYSHGTMAIGGIQNTIYNCAVGCYASIMNQDGDTACYINASDAKNSTYLSRAGFHDTIVACEAHTFAPLFSVTRRCTALGCGSNTSIQSGFCFNDSDCHFTASNSYGDAGMSTLDYQCTFYDCSANNGQYLSSDNDSCAFINCFTNSSGVIGTQDYGCIFSSCAATEGALISQTDQNCDFARVNYNFIGANSAQTGSILSAINVGSQFSWCNAANSGFLAANGNNNIYAGCTIQSGATDAFFGGGANFSGADLGCTFLSDGSFGTGIVSSTNTNCTINYSEAHGGATLAAGLTGSTINSSFVFGDAGTLGNCTECFVVGNGASVTGINNSTTVGGNLILHNGLIGSSSLPSNTPGTGAGTSPTVTVTGTNLSGTITVLTGSGPAGSNATIVTVSYNGLTFPTGSYPVLFPASATAAALTGTTGIYATGTTTTFLIKSGSSALGATTTYVWNYQVSGN